jgi:hypothetical protein
MMVNTPMTVRLELCWAETAPACDESLTCTVKVAVELELLVEVGVPKICPALFNCIPVGSEPPTRLQLSVPTPPEAARVAV